MSDFPFLDKANRVHQTGKQKKSTSTRVYKSKDHSQSHGHITLIYLIFEYWEIG